MPEYGKRCNIKVAFTTYEAAYSAMQDVPNADHVYRGECCGYYHFTSMTEAEFAQAMATRGVQDSATRGMLDLTPEEYLAVIDRRQADEEALEARLADEGRQSRAGAGGPASPAQQRGKQARPAPSPAALARRLEGRSGT